MDVHPGLHTSEECDLAASMPRLLLTRYRKFKEQ